MRRRRWLVALGLPVLLSLPFVYVQLVERPSLDRDWSPDQAVMPSAAVDGDKVTIDKVRKPLKGLLRQYELMYVVADERDVIGLRTNFRRDPVYLYPVKTTRERMRTMFLEMLARANRLALQPEFYNSLTNNCTSNIVAHVNTLAPGSIPFSYKTLFPAYSDRLAYELGLIPADEPFEKVQAAHRIDGAAQQAPVGPDFSRLIRGHGL